MNNLFFKMLFIYLFLERWEGKEKERDRNIDVQEINQLVNSRIAPNWDLAGIELVTLRFTDLLHSVH